jgi:phytoene dehydrogenase-like protein
LKTTLENDNLTVELMENPDVIVVGGGIGGLVSAGLLVRRGLKVLLLEKEDKVGGYVTGFRQHGVYFDATGAFVAACLPGGEFHSLLSELGLEETLSFLPIGSVWNIFPDMNVRFNYSTPEAYIDVLRREFPEKITAMEAYARQTRKMGAEFLAFETAGVWKRFFFPFYFPTLMRYARKSHQHILTKFFGEDARIHLALSTLPTTLPPSLLSYAFVAVLWAKVLGSGVFYPKGGMQALSTALAGVIKQNGGQIVCNCPVKKFITRRNKITGLKLSDGGVISSRWVISNTNPFHADHLFQGKYRPYRGMYRFDRYKPSLSAVLFYVGLPKKALPDDWPYFISIHTTWNCEAMYTALQAGDMTKGLHLVITTPTVLDDSLGTKGAHSLKILVHAPGYRNFINQYAGPEAITGLRRHVFSMIRKHTGIDIESAALFVETATPLTLMTRTGNENGAMYGLDAACGQVGPQRPPNRTRLSNLLWVGHYTRPSHGIVGSAMSGSFAANIIRRKTGR